MIEQIEKIQMPDWLLKKQFNFQVQTILKDSLYYPCSGLDGDPVKYFMGNVYSFFYVDYGVSREDFLNELKRRGFRGYHIIHQQTITQKDLTPNGWTIYIQPDKNEIDRLRLNEEFYRNWIKKPFCEWVIFERDEDKDDTYNPKMFSLLYLCADGIAAYQAIYLSNNIKPRMIAIIQPGTGFGGNWTDFRDRGKIFARSIFYKKELLPEYLINGGWGKDKDDYYKKPIFKEYSELIIKFYAGKATLSVWKRTENFTSSL